MGGSELLLMFAQKWYAIPDLLDYLFLTLKRCYFEISTGDWRIKPSMWGSMVEMKCLLHRHATNYGDGEDTTRMRQGMRESTLLDHLSSDWGARALKKIHQEWLQMCYPPKENYLERELTRQCGQIGRAKMEVYEAGWPRVSLKYTAGPQEVHLNFSGPTGVCVATQQINYWDKLGEENNEHEG